MKKIVLIIVLLQLFSCDKLPINGKLDGMWQLMEIEYTNGIVEHPEKTYYSIQLHLIKLSKVYEGSLHGSNAVNYVGRFEYTADSLVIKDLRANKDEDLVTKEQLIPFGLNGPVDRFKIEKLTNDKMILQSGSVMLSFRKF